MFVRKQFNIAGWSSLVARRAHNPKVAWFKSRPRNQVNPCHYSNGKDFFMFKNNYPIPKYTELD